MRAILPFLGALMVAGVPGGAAEPGPAPGPARPNVLFLAIDDLRNDLGVLGVAHARTPHLDALAASGRLFRRHYVQVPTCGASRAALWRGRYPTEPAHLGNHAIRDTHGAWAADSLPARFREAGYRTLALGKLTHFPGGRTGRGWAEGPEELPGAWDRAWVPEGPWPTPQAMMHGYANGMARRAGESPPWEAHDGPDEAYPDAWVAAEAVATLERLAMEKGPWFFAVGFFKPHLPFAAPKAWHDLHAGGVAEPSPDASVRPVWASGWHRSGELRGNYGHPAGRDPETDPGYARELRRAYAASVSYADAQVGRVLEALQRLELDGSTVVVVWSDHGFLLGEHAIWGKHCLYEHALRAPLILRTPGLPRPGQASDAIVESVDLYPTLAALCGVPVPRGLDGRSLGPLLRDPQAPSEKPALGFWSGGQRTIRTDRWRLIAHGWDGGTAEHWELFDCQEDPDETRNVAGDRPEVVRALAKHLASRSAKGAASGSD